VALTVLGVGWALLFAGGSALLVTQYVPHEKGLAQGVHDALMFLSMTLSSASAGLLMALESWQLLQWTALPVMGAVLLALMLLARRSAAAISVARGA
jgi:MFS family permease